MGDAHARSGEAQSEASEISPLQGQLAGRFEEIGQGGGGAQERIHDVQGGDQGDMREAGDPRSNHAVGEPPMCVQKVGLEIPSNSHRAGKIGSEKANARCAHCTNGTEPSKSHRLVRKQRTLYLLRGISGLL